MAWNRAKGGRADEKPLFVLWFVWWFVWGLVLWFVCLGFVFTVFSLFLIEELLAFLTPHAKEHRARLAFLANCFLLVEFLRGENDSLLIGHIPHMSQSSIQKAF